METFLAENAKLKANQSDAVVKYFKDELEETTEQLGKAEDDLLDFNRSNKLMNYYEQTKQLASRRENFEASYIYVEQRYTGAKAILEAIEDRMSQHAKKRVYSEKLLDYETS